MRFKTEDRMWEYLQSDKCLHKQDFQGTTIYVNADLEKVPGGEAREKAVRKMVRAIIEGVGKDGNETRKTIEVAQRRVVSRAVRFFSFMNDRSRAAQ